MTSVDCERLKQIRDDAYTQLVLVQIEAKDQSTRKGFLGIFKSSEKKAETGCKTSHTRGNGYSGEVRDRKEEIRRCQSEFRKEL